MASGEQEDAGTRGITPREIERRFTYHAPKGDQGERYIALREQGKVLAEAIVKMTPACREQSLAVTKLEEAIMWANAAIARRE
jgi:hypothetical protein